MKTLDLELIALFTMMFIPVVSIFAGMMFKTFAFDYVGSLLVGATVVWLLALVVALTIDTKK